MSGCAPHTVLGMIAGSSSAVQHLHSGKVLPTNQCEIKTRGMEAAAKARTQYVNNKIKDREMEVSDKRKAVTYG